MQVEGYQSVRKSRAFLQFFLKVGHFWNFGKKQGYIQKNFYEHLYYSLLCFKYIQSNLPAGETRMRHRAIQETNFSSLFLKSMPEVKFNEITSYNVLNNLQVCKYACVLKQKVMAMRSKYVIT